MPKKPSAAARLGRAARELVSEQQRRDPAKSSAGRKAEKGTAGRGAARQHQSMRAKADTPSDLQTNKLPQIVRTTENGTLGIFLQFFDTKYGIQKLDLSRLLRLPNLTEPLLAGLKGHLQTVARPSRPSVLGTFWNGFFKFMIEMNDNARLEELDDVLFHQYVSWQQSPKAATSKANALSSQTIRQRIGILRGVMTHVSKVQPWAAEGLRALGEIPKNLSYVDDSRPVEVLPLDQLLAIQRAAAKELAVIGARLKKGEQLLLEGKKKRFNGSEEFNSPDVALAAMVELHPEDFPTASQAKDLPRPLFSAIYKSSRGDQRIVNLASFRYASPSDLVPIIVLLAIEGGFNPDSILALETHHIVRTTLFGVPITDISAPKFRAKGGVQRKKLDSEVVEPWLDLLSELTKRIRSVAAKEFSDHAFIYKSHFGHAKHAKGLAGPSRNLLKFGLDEFCHRHSLPRFSLSNIRATMIDLVGQRHGSIAAHQVAGHTSFGVTDKHYVKPGTRQRDREKLGEVMQYTQRFIESRGSIDVRRSARPAGSDKGAATPGFSCIDPYDSPQPSQRANVLCRAYGRCPACPMAAVSPEDPHSVAYWLALVEAIHAARANLDAQHWLMAWGPVAIELIELLENVDARTMAKAKQMSVFLPPIE